MCVVHLHHALPELIGHFLSQQQGLMLTGKIHRGVPVFRIIPFCGFDQFPDIDGPGIIAPCCGVRGRFISKRHAHRVFLDLKDGVDGAQNIGGGSKGQAGGG